MDSTVGLLTLLFLVLAFVLLVLNTQFLRVLRQRGVQLALRRIPAYQQVMPPAVGEAVESARPMHVSFGGSGLGAETTVSALAASEVLYHLAERVAVGNEPPIISLSDPTALGLAQGTLRRAYQTRQRLGAYRSSAARWYPPGLAFAAGVGAALAEEDANMSVLVGRLGPELAFIGEAATRYDQVFIAQSDQPEGQAVGWVMSESPLIGEELYAAGAYLSRHPSALQLSQLLATEILRLVVILGIVLAAVLAVASKLGGVLSVTILIGAALAALLAAVLYARSTARGGK